MPDIKPHSNLPDKDRRKRQSDRIVRILRVHKLTHDKHDVTALDVSKRIGCSERTIYRDLSTLKVLYETLGTTKLD